MNIPIEISKDTYENKQKEAFSKEFNSLVKELKPKNKKVGPVLNSMILMDAYLQATKKEREEASRLDQEVQARVRARNKEFHKDL
ncbi:hypothetical protein CVD25_06495 [Bacillus canaveralius]|uniref:Uncharacterized protein n=1 Tax=Bacillus canaveralius TaxID=1403243 RepID=A0A2N5GG43_9BACI|nr:hypothetical protein [Bacillus canaveralius]PLR79701.1 hypothetical protein CU635_21650 [Bacillus canaveralius]PLR99167.1 hypothetical protein CVD25_06495 [Bacillus canaveralius]